MSHKFQVGDRVDVFGDGRRMGEVLALPDSPDGLYEVRRPDGRIVFHFLDGAVLAASAPEQDGIDRLNAENECYRKEAQEARALQRKFYDESVDLRKRLAQAIAERDAANQQCACVVQKYDDLRACLKALAR